MKSRDTRDLNLLSVYQHRLGVDIFRLGRESACRNGTQAKIKYEAVRSAFIPQSNPINRSFCS
ncbi:MAG: hypothetical protein HN736_18260 [Anaerolineae bacterium]|nr:hypothetical protein [Anaerolineae bacterium]MBT3712193.1 hypothetical protein [Anaerolineae bacterium]MBT4311839.1 hypothetical protein [Anaerolineae bacterium]MBT4456655.1 hypothetical protein [Anaerolineae bacterium]MBT4843331.1 hypothetical protein [Anaerolineae bacterium]